MNTYKRASEAQRSGVALGAVVGVLLALCGGTVGGAERAGGGYSEDEARLLLRTDLQEFEQYIKVSMADARAILVKRNVAAADLAKLDAWQNAQLLRFGGALHQADPLVALMDAWAVNAALANYLDRNSAPDELPLSLRDVALDMLKRREARLAHIASRYLPPDSIAALSSRIDAFAAGHAIPKTEILQTDSGSWTSPLFSVWAKGQAAVGSLLQLPLMPGRALGGMAKTGEAMTGIRESTAQAVQIAGELPERMRVAFQSALTNLVAQRAEIMEILGAMDAVSTNLRATAEAAHVTAAEARKSMVLARELLPAGAALADGVERAVKASTELVRAVTAFTAQPPPGQTGVPAEQSRKFDVREYEAAAMALAGAAGEVQRMLVEVRALIEANRDTGTAKDAEGFDIREYRATAEAIDRGAAGIRGIMGDVCTLTRDAGFQGRLAEFGSGADASVGRAAERVEGVIDHCAWRCAQCAVLVFLLACLYVRLRRRWSCREGRPAGGGGTGGGAVAKS